MKYDTLAENMLEVFFQHKYKEYGVHAHIDTDIFGSFINVYICLAVWMQKE
jgi:hypothetical protein